jgi:hypothetical protein
MDSIIWAIKHTMRDIADTGLNRECCLTLVDRTDRFLRSVLGGHQQLCRRRF